jgi:alpha-tubulin suppressor-like RCC1 family protein
LLRGIKVDAVIAGVNHMLALADDGSVYVWGNERIVSMGALGLGQSVRDAGCPVRESQRVPALRVACRWP